MPNKEDFTTFKLFCQKIKTVAGDINHAWFITDIAPQFYDAFCAVFNCETIHLHCTWHVDKALKEQLKSNIKKFAIEVEVYKQLRIVLEQTKEKLFDNYLSALCERLHNSVVTNDFENYFDRYWVPCKEKWGSYGSVGLGINTNMFCEDFHCVFKYTYLKGKVNKRVDKCLVNLVKYNRDKTFGRIKKLTKGKLIQKLSTIQVRHRNSLNLDFGSITQSEENSWTCKLEDGKRNYAVILNSQRCDDRQCNLKFSNCNICVHTYTSYCVDFLLYSTICKHTYLVHQYRERNERKTEICEKAITERNDDKDEESIQLTGMVKDETKSDFALAEKNVSIYF